MTEPKITAMVDEAMVEMANISPPLSRSECERLIRAAFAASPAPAAQDTPPGAHYAIAPPTAAATFDGCTQHHKLDTGTDLQDGPTEPRPTLRACRFLKQTVSIRSGSMVVDGEGWPDGSREILIDDFVAVRVNYEYPHTDNLSVRNLAEQIKALLEGGRVVRP